MKFVFSSFEPADVVALDLQETQVGQLGPYEPVRNLKHGIELKAMGPAWTLRNDTGDVLACSGFGEVFPGQQATIWALIADVTAARFAVVRFMRARLAEMPYHRIEALARASHPKECRLLEAVGFGRPHRLRKWGPAAEDHILYERII